MKKLPENLAGTNAVFHMLNDAVKAHATLIALELGIFESFKTRRSPASVAKERELHPPSLAVFLELLRVAGMVEKHGDTFQNTSFTTTMFLTDAFASIIPMLESMRYGILDRLYELGSIVKNGPSWSMPEAFTLSVEQYQNDARANACWAFRGVAPALAEEFTRLPGASSFKRMLDLGGSHGVFSLYAAQALPGLTADVLDAPAPLTVAEQYAKDWQMTDRIRMVAKDYVRDDLEQGYDLVLASCTLNFTLHDEQTADVVQKVYSALNPGGYFISLHDGPPSGVSAIEVHSTNEAEYPLGCLVAEMLTGRRMAMPQNFMADTMLQCGFNHVHSREFRTSGGLFALDIGRKIPSS